MKKLLVLGGVFLSMVALFSVGNVMAAVQEKVPAPVSGQKIMPKEVRVSTKHNDIIDRIEFYDDNGKISRIEVSTKGDGKMDEKVYYKDGIAVKGEKDANGNGIIETTMFYDAKGTIIKTETSTKDDGKVNEWVYYSNGIPVRAEKDTNGDGKPDTWITY
jgi:hypothetical protein